MGFSHILTKKQLMYDIKNISIKQFLSEQGILPKQERTGYGLHPS
ncbi:DNA primase [Mucinivorans hirudinis]|uniref:DNA primase n=1 Tax=Mucinivorans hirudinis TaxID=1433126 RepID=A0A060RAE1_9BACT|nr:DNA primase [Mucinivorans hirudinis]